MFWPVVPWISTILCVHSHSGSSSVRSRSLIAPVLGFPCDYTQVPTTKLLGLCYLETSVSCDPKKLGWKNLSLMEAPHMVFILFYFLFSLYFLQWIYTINVYCSIMNMYFVTKKIFLNTRIGPLICNKKKVCVGKTNDFKSIFYPVAFPLSSHMCALVPKMRVWANKSLGSVWVLWMLRRREAGWGANYPY